MKKLTVLLMLSGILVSCQKEILDTDSGTPDPPGGGGSTTGLLVKSVGVTDNTDTLTTLYGYDNQKRLETETMDGTSGGMVTHSYRKFERDATGRISRILQHSVTDGVATDTSVNQVHYPNASGFDYNYTLTNISWSGFSVIDSSTYSYSGGKMMNVTEYLSSSLLGPVGLQTSTFDFTYDGAGRVASIKISSTGSVPGGTMQPYMTESYSYGSTIDGVYSTNNGAQNYLLGGLPNAINDVVSKIQVQDLTGTSPGVNATVTMSYVIGAGNKPTSVVATTAGAQPSVSKTTYYYQ
jgi:hypothetical protein